MHSSLTLPSIHYNRLDTKPLHIQIIEVHSALYGIPAALNLLFRHVLYTISCLLIFHRYTRPLWYRWRWTPGLGRRQSVTRLVILSFFLSFFFFFHYLRFNFFSCTICFYENAIPFFKPHRPGIKRIDFFSSVYFAQTCHMLNDFSSKLQVEPQAETTGRLIVHLKYLLLLSVPALTSSHPTFCKVYRFPSGGVVAAVAWTEERARERRNIYIYFFIFIF